MATAKFDITVLRDEATRSLYAGVGVADLAVGTVRDYVAEVQKRATARVNEAQKLDYDPAALRAQAVTVVNARVDALSKDAKARRKAVEARVAELQAQLQTEAKAFPNRVTTLVNDNVSVVGGRYTELAKRGEDLVGRIRSQESTKAATKAAKTTVAKAKTTVTQARHAVEAEQPAATKPAAKKTAAKKAPAKKAAAKKTDAVERSAKATVTAARKTATNAAKAVVEGVEKIGD